MEQTSHSVHSTQGGTSGTKGAFGTNVTFSTFETRGWARAKDELTSSRISAYTACRQIFSLPMVTGWPASIRGQNREVGAIPTQSRYCNWQATCPLNISDKIEILRERATVLSYEIHLHRTDGKARQEAFVARSQETCPVNKCMLNILRVRGTSHRDIMLSPALVSG